MFVKEAFTIQEIISSGHLEMCEGILSSNNNWHEFHGQESQSI